MRARRRGTAAVAPVLAGWRLHAFRGVHRSSELRARVLFGALLRACERGQLLLRAVQDGGRAACYVLEQARAQACCVLHVCGQMRACAGALTSAAEVRECEPTACRRAVWRGSLPREPRTQTYVRACVRACRHASACARARLCVRQCAGVGWGGGCGGKAGNLEGCCHNRRRRRRRLSTAQHPCAPPAVT